ncbi:MAG: hypothetical protein QNJ51_04240 [Calothrix sp. MO_167.B12]|nr:hypothetical protein [Calothrix sp. MO_167.B12]
MREYYLYVINVQISLSILKRGLKPHPLRVVCFVLGFKSPLQNIITNYELRITNCLISMGREFIKSHTDLEVYQMAFNAAMEIFDLSK